MPIAESKLFHPVACNLCGNVRSEKVVWANSAGVSMCVCKNHFIHDGNLVNEATQDAIVGMWLE